MSWKGDPVDGVVLYVKTMVACLFFAVGVLAVTLLVALSLATVESLYSGDMVTRPGYRATGAAEVLGCEEVGPITTHGFGMWWNCTMVVELVDGRSVRTTVDASVVTPEDRGMAVDVVEFCRHPQHQECTYTRPGNLALTLGTGIVQIVKIAIVVCGVGLSVVALFAGLLGGKLPRRSKTRGGGKIAPDEEKSRDAEREAGANSSMRNIPPGFAELIINFDYPRTGAQVIYETTAPTVRIDGASPRGESSWEECRVLVAAGKRKCEVWVPFEALRFGYISRNVKVAEGTRVSLQYQAPRTPGAPGSLE
ncbi:DUF6346 domain-containing protein [Plantactinospora soyae]|uniref:Uncharacterized protein n=1 Tax=Plantactinospora soyae TaxID=1544732 RepID=A0A927M4L9_9ACTN|nr:DUF6346 domain-containing protein [Plantactinospora soyae]MBE1487624.1 hypothetical protein [Plantactinospora soyae]